MGVTLREITAANRAEVLALRTTPEQERFVSTVEYSLREAAATVERALEAWVPVDAPAGLGEAMRYGVLDGGKRVRPLLALLAIGVAAAGTRGLGQARSTSSWVIVQPQARKQSDS